MDMMGGGKGERKGKGWWWGWLIIWKAFVNGKLGSTSCGDVGCKHMVIPECIDEVFGQEYLLIFAVEQIVFVLVQQVPTRIDEVHF